VASATKGFFVRRKRNVSVTPSFCQIAGRFCEVAARFLCQESRSLNSVLQLASGKPRLSSFLCQSSLQWCQRKRQTESPVDSPGQRNLAAAASPTLHFF
jgi:hypothetical protein